MIIPLLASFYPPRAFYREWKPFLLANLSIASLFLVWDFCFTAQGIWGFNPDYLTGFYVANLPIEEVLFFVCIPFACVFTYFILKFLVVSNPFSKNQRTITLFLMIILLGAGLMSIGMWYTVTTAFVTFLYLLVSWMCKIDMAYKYLTYFVVLPFFFLSNGVLTGGFLEAPIVWYNNAENLGIRISTIPVEDIFYGFLLVVMNIDMYVFFRKKLITNF
jgi:lycopene cyclase domain-containing protein